MRHVCVGEPLPAQKASTTLKAESVGADVGADVGGSQANANGRSGDPTAAHPFADSIAVQSNPLKSTFVRRSSPGLRNALLPRLRSETGNVMKDKAPQFLKAFAPIVSRILAPLRSTLVIEGIVVKASSPIVDKITAFEKTTELAVHCLNVFDGTLVKSAASKTEKLVPQICASLSPKFVVSPCLKTNCASAQVKAKGAELALDVTSAQSTPLKSTVVAVTRVPMLKALSPILETVVGNFTVVNFEAWWNAPTSIVTRFVAALMSTSTTFVTELNAYVSIVTRSVACVKYNVMTLLHCANA
jgi:hypothetical protein